MPGREVDMKKTEELVKVDNSTIYKTTTPVFLSVSTFELSENEPKGYYFTLYLPLPEGKFNGYKIGDLIIPTNGQISEVRQIMAFHPAADLIVTISPSHRKYISGNIGSMRVQDLDDFSLYFRPA